ncbi:MAG: class II aldolase/adducin family protein [Pseudomonadota bacterium]
MSAAQAATVAPLATQEMSPTERQARLDLAILYRAFVHYGWTDFLYTHISARVPDQPDCYLINPYGLLFHEVNAGNLIKVTLAGEVIAGDYPFNDAGHGIHSAVLGARPDAMFVAHSHTRAGIAVSAMRQGLMPLSQQANEIRREIAYHAYDVVTEAAEECERLTADLGAKNLMIMHNHGLLTLGRTAGECFYNLYTLENACKVQVDVLACDPDPILPSEEAQARAALWGVPGPEAQTQKEWAALSRLIEKVAPDYKEF